MRYSELVTQPVQEAPMGFFSQLGNKIASKLGSATAQGRLEAGQVANYLYKQFLKNLGASGQQPTPEVLAGFLQSAGVPKQSIQAANNKVISQASAQAAQPKAAQPDANQPTGQPTNQTTLTDNTNPAASKLNRKQIGQFILSAVQHANQAGTLSFGNNADTGGQTGAPQSQQADDATKGQTSGSDISPELLKQIQQLSAKQKQELLGMLP